MRRRTFLGHCAALTLGRFAIAEPQGTAQRLAARERAARFLIGRQSRDGAWRSNVYGAFKDGRALTPLACLALEKSRCAFACDAAAKAMSWIELQSTSIAELFPIHNASWILQATVGSENRVALRGAMVERLRQLQLNASMSWDREHPYFGGWSYAPRAPRAAKNIAPFQQPNLSASVLAIAGLSSAGVCSDEPVMQDALGFVRRCQNLSARGQAPSKFDDGGFFQLHDDPSRNKAGPAGTEADGTTRQRSYTSASADGLRGLVMCGLGDGDLEVDEARRWLDKHLRLGDVPDLRHYAAYSVADAQAGLPQAAGKPVWRDRVDGALIGTQATDGSWHNPAGEMRENDPLLRHRSQCSRLPDRLASEHPIDNRRSTRWRANWPIPGIA